MAIINKCGRQITGTDKDKQKATVNKLHAYIEKKGYGFNGKHHEIYLSDPRKATPEKLKTRNNRQPIRKI